MHQTNDIKILTKLSHELDPFLGPTEKQLKLLKKIGIAKTDDPFQLTNEIIFRLETALNSEAQNTHKKQ